LVSVDYKLRYTTEDQGLGNAFGTSYTMEKKERFGKWTGKCTCGSGLLGTVGGCLRTGPKGKKLTRGSTKFHDDKLHHLPVPANARSKAKVCRRSPAVSRGFEYHRGHVCLSVVNVVFCQVEVL